MTFFESLQTPSWMPPDAAFPIVWFSLWVLQAIAVALVLSSERSNRIGLLVFGAQLLLSLAWQAVLFGPGRLAVSAWALVAVVTLVVATALRFWSSSKIAGALMLPTLAWVSFATALAFELNRLNPNA